MKVTHSGETPGLEFKSFPGMMAFIVMVFAVVGFLMLAAATVFSVMAFR